MEQTHTHMEFLYLTNEIHISTYKNYNANPSFGLNST